MRPCLGWCADFRALLLLHPSAPDNNSSSSSSSCCFSFPSSFLLGDRRLRGYRSQGSALGLSPECPHRAGAAAAAAAVVASVAEGGSSAPVTHHDVLRCRSYVNMMSVEAGSNQMILVLSSGSDVCDVRCLWFVGWYVLICPQSTAPQQTDHASQREES